MGAFKTALTGRLMAAVAVCFAIAITMFMCGGVGNVAAEEVVIEIPTSLATETNNTTVTSWYGLTIVEWILAAVGVLCLLAFFFMRDFRLLILSGAVLALVVIMAYI